MDKLANKRPGPKPKSLTLQTKLENKGVNLVDMLANLLTNPETSDRIKADLLKDALNYCYSKKKSVVIEDNNGQAITFNLNLGK